MALAAFQSDQQALDFLYGGPVADPQLNIAPEAPVEMELGPDRMIQAADAAFLDDLDARGEPRLPQEDEDLPPVVPAEQPQAPAPFASDEEALAFLSAGAEERRVETPRPTLEAGQTSGPGFGSDEEALAFLQGAEQRAPEIKLRRGRRFNLRGRSSWTRPRGRNRGWMAWCRWRRGVRWRRRPRRARRSRC
jgi:hypothetical protein